LCTFLFSITVLLSSNTSVKAQIPKLTHFAMGWAFVDADGSNERGWNDVCVGDQVYVINKSRYGAMQNGGNGAWPIGNLLVDGDYDFWSWPMTF